ncbi:hypothetical protein [Streptomyces sp. ME19-01-6]|nr:hypothetical protein [Streptomyces sp. ME19-01-6]MDX3233549.1 hypothetical protein [Streptomyces sp. ME19-01-6]
MCGAAEGSVEEQGTLPTALWSSVFALVIEGEAVAEAAHGDLEVLGEQPV